VHQKRHHLKFIGLRERYWVKAKEISEGLLLPVCRYQGISKSAFNIQAILQLCTGGVSMIHRRGISLLILTLVWTLGACAPGLHGTVRLLDPDMIPIEGESPEGTVVNMINTSVSVEEASHSVIADSAGWFESEKDAITKGIYKVEAGKIGYVTDTQTVEVGGGKEEVNLNLRKIPEGKRRSIERSDSDEDKIINPGEVNIQPPIL